jgi:hypothetical protein
MIKVQSKYDPLVEGNWKLTETILFKSSKRSWRKEGYSISNSHLHSLYVGGRPATIGATCLTVWSK